MFNFKKFHVLFFILIIVLSVNFVFADDVSVVNNNDTVKLVDIDESNSFSNSPSSMNITIYSNSLYVSPTGSDSGDGSSANPFRTISRAVDVASSGTNIYLYDGVYSGSANNNIRITTKSLNFIAMDSTSLTAIDGGGVNRLFNVGGNIEINFVGLTLRNGYAVCGAAINVNNSRTTTVVNILNCNITGNVANSYGGALYIHGMDGSYSRFIVENSTLSNNYATYEGGAVFVDWCGSLSIRHTSLINNSVNSNNGFGGAVYNNYLTWCYGALFEGNTAFNGGGIYNYNGNVYTYFNNGENTIFRNNRAYGSGGAIYKNGVYGVGRVNNTLFFNNSALYGGAIALINSTGNMTVINSTFAYNSASREGGAIYNNARSSIYISYCALYGNTAPNGKAISSKSSLCSADYNWWGNNSNPQSSGDIDFKPNTYVIMSMDTVDEGAVVKVNAKLKEYYNVVDNQIYDLSVFIPFNLVTFSADGGFIAPVEATLIDGEYSASYYKDSKDATVYANIGSQTLSASIEGTGVDLYIDSISANLGDTVNVTGYIQVNGENVDNGYVSILNGDLYELTDGRFSIPLYVNITKSGINYIPVTYHSSVFNNTISMLNLTVGAIPTIITIDDIEGSLGDTVSLNVYVKDENGNDVDGIALVHIYNQDTEVNVVNGVGTSLYTIIQPVGEYKITATFSSTGYESSTASANLIVTRQKVNINAEDINGEAGETVNLNINVTNRLGELIDGTVIVNFNRRNTTLNLTNGACVYTTVLPEMESNYNLTITYHEQGDYGETVKVISVGVGVTSTIITGEDMDFAYGTPQDYTIKLSDVNGAVIVGRHVSFKLTRLSNYASKTYDSITDYEGLAKLTIGLAPGEYMVETSYEGEPNRFQPTKTTNYITIRDNSTPQPNVTNKTKTVLNATDFSEVYGAGDNYTGFLTTFDGTPLSGHHVSVLLTRVSSGASKAYDVTCDYTGKFLLQINLAPGNYTALCTYPGVDRYAQTTCFNTITVYRE